MKKQFNPNYFGAPVLEKKYNDNHDEQGRFSSGDGGSSGGASSPVGGGSISRVSVDQAKAKIAGKSKYAAFKAAAKQAESGDKAGALATLKAMTELSPNYFNAKDTLSQYAANPASFDLAGDLKWNAELAKVNQHGKL